MRYTLPKNCLEALHSDDFSEYRWWHCHFCAKNRGGIYTTQLYYRKNGDMWSRQARGCESCCKEYAHTEHKWEELGMIMVNLDAKWERDKRLFTRA